MIPKTFRTLGLTTLAVAALAACQPTTGSVIQSGGLPDAVPAARAVALFDAVCVGSMPTFDSARSRMTQVKVTAPGTDGLIFSQTENLSFRIHSDRNGKACSMVFGTTESKSAAYRVIRSKYSGLSGDLAFSTASYGGGDVTVRQTSEGDSFNYFNIVIVPDR